MNDPDPHGRPATDIRDDESIAQGLGRILSELIPAERRVGRVLLADYPVAGLRTISSLASDAGVSAPSVLRFTQSLGFPNFRSFQEALTLELRTATKPAGDTGAHDPSTPLVAQARALTAHTLDSIANLPMGEVDALVDLLSDPTRRIRVVGGRISGVLAEYMVTLLEQIRPRVTHVEHPYGSGMSAVIDSRPKDVWVVFDFYRYQASSVRLARDVKATKGIVALITDGRLSPASQSADIVIPISVSNPNPFYRLSAVCLLVECLLLPVAARLGEKGEERMNRWDVLHTRELLEQGD